MLNYTTFIMWPILFHATYSESISVFVLIITSVSAIRMFSRIRNIKEKSFLSFVNSFFKQCAAPIECVQITVTETGATRLSLYTLYTVMCEVSLLRADLIFGRKI